MKRFFLFIISVFPLLFSCSNKTNSPLVLWTDRVEFVSYCELYNSLQDEAKIIALYKDAVETTLPAKKSEQRPDIIAGTFLQSGMEKKYFARIDSIFKNVNQDDFYPSLLEYGKFNKKQYLLPVSFNLPALVFQTSNYNYAQSELFSFERIKELSSTFNSKNADGSFRSMGFAPHWNLDFLYLMFKSTGVTYTMQNDQLVYSEGAFNNTLNSINEWSEKINGGIQSEQDFAFKYLYMPFNEQGKNNRCLFSYTTSDKIMALTENQLEEIDFRWICNDGKIQIEDDVVMMGIYSASKNKADAKKFLAWFFNEESQKKILERKFAMKLRTETFGIAGGFSSIQSVNQKLFPTYYRPLLSNLPARENLFAPQIFPADWKAIKENVVLPFIAASTEKADAEPTPLGERYEEYILAQQAEQR